MSGLRGLLALGLLLASCSRDRIPPSIQIFPTQPVADGESQVTVRFSPPGARLDVNGDRHAVEIERREPGVAYLRIGILPAEIRVRVTAPNGWAATAKLIATLQKADSYADGTPDFLRLGPADQQAFRMWFRFLAEAQYYRAPGTLPKEINDCAALLRYAYRESLSEHNSAWANRLGLPELPALPAVRKYAYPFTPLRAGLFRTQLGAFAEFADAQTLERWNCHFVSRDLNRAIPGDLLFYKQIAEASRLPFHSMIFLGPSQIEPSRKTFVLYHTGGPEGIRRLTIDELIEYPLAQWRPIPGNENFLGVFRWNILR
jgi:uncharacterized protein YfaT (DUF1175 family)